MPKESVLLKTVVFWHKSKLEIINKKISPNLMKRTDFLVHKAQFLVRMFITKHLGYKIDSDSKHIPIRTFGYETTKSKGI